MLRLALCLLLALIALFATSARADSVVASLSPRIAVALSDGSRGPLRLTAHGKNPTSYSGEFVVKNRGAAPLAITRIAPRSDDDDIRIPPKLTLRYADASASQTDAAEAVPPSTSTAATIAPNGERRVLVTWMPEAGGRASQLIGHVVVTSNDEAAGEVAMGIRADEARTLGFLTSHPLTILLFLPLAGAIAIVLLHLAHSAGRIRAPALERASRRIAALATGLQTLFALYVFRSFDGTFTRAAGNDGFQFVERAVWIRSLNVEYFVGVDGLSIAMVLLTATLSFVGALGSLTAARRIHGYFALYLVLSFAVTGVFLALDLVLLFAAWQAAVLALHALLRAPRFTAVSLAGSALLLVAFLALYRASDRAVLVDGTAAAHTFAIPELMRVAYNAKNLTLLGFPLVKVAWVFLFAGFAVHIPAFPLHAYLPESAAEAPAPVAAMLLGVVMKMGLYGVLRVAFSLLPESSRWASGMMVALGAVTLLYGALSALAANDLKLLLAYATMSHAGVAMIGLGSLTPQGIAGALVQTFAQGLTAALLVFVIDAIEERAGGGEGARDLRELGGIVRKSPLLGMLLALGLLAAVGVPGTLAFWGTLLPMLGAFATHQGLTVFAGCGLVLSALAHLRPIERLCFGRTSFGIKLPDLYPRELALMAPLVILTIVLGVWPEPLLSPLAGGVHDATSLVNPPGPDQIALGR
jgi:NADH-quinone oxidoreductase subunit M